MRSLKLGGLVVAVLALVPATASARFFGGVVPDVIGGHAKARRAIAQAARLPYRGGPVLHTNRTHLIFWQPAGAGLAFEPGYQSLIERFLSDVSRDSRWPGNVYGLTGQYRDSQGPAAYVSTYAGGVTATDPLPPSGCVEPPGPPLGTGPGWHYCLTEAQLENEVVNVLGADHLPQSWGDVYFLVTPEGLGSCQFTGPDNCALGGTATGSYCGYHSTTRNNVPFAVIPYNAVYGHCQSDNPRPNGSTADPTISTLSHEHREAITDPLGNAWIDSSFQEDADLCITSFGAPIGGSGDRAYNQLIHGDHYYLQDEWSNEDGGCRPRDENDRISFSVRQRLAGVFRFTARGSDPDGAIVKYDWFFGDHRTAHGRRSSHPFRRAGSFRVVLRTTDRAGNWSFFARRVHVGRAARRS